MSNGNHSHWQATREMKWDWVGWLAELAMGGVMWVASPWRFAFYETISKCETNSHKILPARLWHVKWNQIRKWSRTHWVREIKYIKINVNINAVCPSGVYWHFGKRKSRRACEFPWEVDIVIVFVVVVFPAIGGKHIWKPLAHVLMNDVLMWQTAMCSFCIFFFMWNGEWFCGPSCNRFLDTRWMNNFKDMHRNLSDFCKHVIQIVVYTNPGILATDLKCTIIYTNFLLIAIVIKYTRYLFF